MNNWVAVVTTGGQIEGKRWIIFALLTWLPWKCYERPHKQSRWMDDNALCTHCRTRGVHPRLWYIIPKEFFWGVLWAFMENSQSVFEHPLGSHWDALVFIIHESTHRCPASSISNGPTLTVFAGEVAAPSSWFFFFALLQERDETRCFLKFFLEQGKTALNYRTFFIVRALQPNIMPTIRGWKSILSTWMFIFCSRKR